MPPHFANHLHIYQKTVTLLNMKIAFVGKGGSGKSTVATLFFLHLLEQSKITICVDADLNIHIPKLLNLDLPETKSLSNTNNTTDIKKYLIGSSAHIASPNHMYKTTPPSAGVNLVTLTPDNHILKQYATQLKTGYVMAVGTYEASEIGRSCYHTNLSILENILSFAHLQPEEWLVADMVAGIDAFSNTLHAQFDILCLIVEPTTESVSVYHQYRKLADVAGVLTNLRVIGNKIEDASDEQFLQSNIKPEHFIGCLNRNNLLKQRRRDKKPLTPDLIDKQTSTLFNTLMDTVVRHRIEPNKRLELLHTLHNSYITQDYVRDAVGDISNQIDASFIYPN